MPEKNDFWSPLRYILLIVDVAFEIQQGPTLLSFYFLSFTLFAFLSFSRETMHNIDFDNAIILFKFIFQTPETAHILTIPFRGVNTLRAASVLLCFVHSHTGHRRIF